MKIDKVRLAKQEEALARLRFLVDSQRRLGLLLGEQARAKSQLLEGFSRELACDGHAVALVNLCSAGPGEMLWQIAECLGGKPGAEDDIGRLWRCLTASSFSPRAIRCRRVRFIQLSSTPRVNSVFT